jgi:LPXTG-motif cell wall-anchored protein
VGEKKMKKNYLRAVLSFVIAGMMALSMFTAGTSTVKAEDATVTWTTSKSKTATALDANYETKVTLSLPSAEEQLKSDVVLVMDVSDCAAGTKYIIQNLYQQIDAQIKKNNAALKIGVVLFKGTAMVGYSLQDYTVSSYTEILNQVNEKLEKAMSDGSFYNHRTNIPAGLACAKELLDNDNTVEASRKHMILVSDGATYTYCNITSKNSKNENVYDYTSLIDRTALDGNELGNLYEWNVTHPLQAGDVDLSSWTPANWDEYIEKINTAESKEDLSKHYDFDYRKIMASADPKAALSKYIMPLTNTDYTDYYPVNNVEKSFSESVDIYNQMKNEGYDCSAYMSAKSQDNKLILDADNNVIDASIAPIFTQFMNYLAGGTAKSISSISNDIFYLLSTGSTVTDYMGKSETYDFNFVNDIANLTLTVSGTSYTTTKGTNLNTGETAKYLFTSAGVTAKQAKGATTEPEAPYVLHYYDGSDGTPERFVWEINEDVSEFARVQLTYSEKLTNPQSTAGDYSVYTNDVIANNQIVNPTILTPKDSNGKSGETEAFTSPVVKYTVLPKTDDKPSPAPVPTTNPTDNRPTTPTTDDRNERPNTPNTGDQTNAPLAASVLAVALLTCGLAFFFKKKYSN